MPARPLGCSRILRTERTLPAYSPAHSHPGRPPRSRFGGRHELGQNFLRHRPSIDRIVELVRRTDGPILEIGPGDGALTAGLAELGRPLTLIELDEHRVRRLIRRFPSAEVIHADVMSVRIDSPVVVGNLPFHLTTPLLRKLLRHARWDRAILLTQWEVARKRAGVGGGTMLTAQTAPWFEFGLRGRVPAHAFDPMPSVDGGILEVSRRTRPLVPEQDRAGYERFVRRVFTARGRGAAQILRRGIGLPDRAVDSALQRAGLRATALPRDVSPEQWATLWRAVREAGGANTRNRPEHAGPRGASGGDRSNGGGEPRSGPA